MARRSPMRPAPGVLWVLLGTLCLAGIAGAHVAVARGLATTGAGCTPGSGLTLNATPSSGAAPMTVQFAISDPHGPPSWVNWTFGDGSPPANGQGDPYLSTSHRYTAWGLFEAVVNITQGSQSLLCAAAIEVNPPAFALSIHAAPASGPAPLTVHFTVNLTGGTTVYRQAAWTFGDGSVASGFDVNYTYPAPGNYTATLTVVDSANQTAADQLHVAVSASVLPHNTPGPTSNAPIPGWALPLGAGIALVLAVLVGLWWRLGTNSRPSASPPTAPPGGPTPTTEDAPDPERTEGSRSVPGFVEQVPSRPEDPAFRPEIVAAGVEVGNGASAMSGEAELADRSDREPPVAEPSGAPRLKLSQRVMLHLYLQGHLADGEVAPIGFTQGGMADKLVVAQSPLSSVLRRLVVAGLVSQDTRHVHGQPRRLRVYRLTSVGEVVARDLYRHSLEETGPSHRDD